MHKITHQDNIISENKPIAHFNQINNELNVMVNPEKEEIVIQYLKEIGYELELKRKRELFYNIELVFKIKKNPQTPPTTNEPATTFPSPTTQKERPPPNPKPDRSFGNDW